MKSIFDYLDYRLFLREYIDFQKERKPFFSYRYLAEKIGVDASNIAKVVAEKRHLSKPATDSLIALLQFNRRESNYFRTLIELAKTDCDHDRDAIIENLAKIKTVQPHTVEEPQYEYYSTWYHSAILAFLWFFDFKDDFTLLASKLEPAITPSEAEKSIDLLLQLELIKRDESGYFRHTQSSTWHCDHWIITRRWNGTFPRLLSRHRAMIFQKSKRLPRSIAKMSFGLSKRANTRKRCINSIFNCFHSQGWYENENCNSTSSTFHALPLFSLCLRAASGGIWFRNH